MRQTTFTLSKAMQLLLISSLAGSLLAQEVQSSMADASSGDAPASVTTYASLRYPDSIFRISPVKPAALPVAFLPQVATPGTQSASAANAPRQANWARRHLLLLTGLAATGAGAALVAGGGPGTVSGCLNAGPYGRLECTTATTWGASGRHLAGLSLLGVGVPLTIFGFFKHP